MELFGFFFMVMINFGIMLIRSIDYLCYKVNIYVVNIYLDY